MSYRSRSAGSVGVLLTIIAASHAWSFGASGAQGTEPKVVAKAGTLVLILPQEAQAAMKTSYPGFRVPGRSDMRGSWGTVTSGEALPFATWGDYDGNGFVDIALIVLGQGEWKLVVLEQVTARKYKGTTLNGGPISNRDANLENPHEVLLATLKKGEEEVIDSFYEEKSPRYEYPVDAIKMTQVEGALWLYHWDGTKYAQAVLNSE